VDAMGYVRRVRRILASNINDLIDRAENPEKMLNQLTLEMESSIEEAKNRVATAIAAERRLRSHHERERRDAAVWEERAKSAIEQGDDDLAREALRRKKLHGELADSYQRELETQAEGVQGLRSSLEALRRKLEEARMTKRALIARYRTAQARGGLGRIRATVIDTTAFDAFERMADKIEELEIRGQVAAEFAVDALEEKFRTPEEEAAIDAELTELKESMALPAPEGAQSS
jgi:phage shock protein A